MGHQGAEGLKFSEIGIVPDPDQDPDLPPGPGPDLRIPRRRIVRDLDMSTGNSGPATNLGRESSLKVAVAPLTRSRSQINLNYEVGLTIVDNFVVIGGFHEFELMIASNT